MLLGEARGLFGAILDSGLMVLVCELAGLGAIKPLPSCTRRLGCVRDQIQGLMHAMHVHQFCIKHLNHFDKGTGQ